MTTYVPSTVLMSHESYRIPLPWLHGWRSENKVPTHSGSRTHSATELLTSGCRVKCEPGRECFILASRGPSS